MYKAKNDKITKMILKDKKPNIYVTTRQMDEELHKFLITDAKARGISLNKLTLMIFRAYREEQLK